jgi:hypothetical protein
MIAPQPYEFEYVSHGKNTQQWRSASQALEVVWRSRIFPVFSLIYSNGDSRLLAKFENVPHVPRVAQRACTLHYNVIILHIYILCSLYTYHNDGNSAAMELESILSHAPVFKRQRYFRSLSKTSKSIEWLCEAASATCAARC